MVKNKLFKTLKDGTRIIAGKRKPIAGEYFYSMCCIMKHKPAQIIIDFNYFCSQRKKNNEIFLLILCNERNGREELLVN